MSAGPARAKGFALFVGGMLQVSGMLVMVLGGLCSAGSLVSAAVELFNQQWNELPTVWMLSGLSSLAVGGGLLVVGRRIESRGRK
jgi:hypothetical protein